jgi:hypothetical protein
MALQGELVMGGKVEYIENIPERDGGEDEGFDKMHVDVCKECSEE